MWPRGVPTVEEAEDNNNARTGGSAMVRPWAILCPALKHAKENRAFENCLFSSEFPILALMRAVENNSNC